MRCEHNIGTLERWVRVFGGVLAVVAALALLRTTTSFLLEGLAVVVVLLGFDSTLTGLTGYCPVYGLMDRGAVAPGHAHNVRHRSKS